MTAERRHIDSRRSYVRFQALVGILLNVLSVASQGTGASDVIAKRIVWEWPDRRSVLVGKPRLRPSTVGAAQTTRFATSSSVRSDHDNPGDN